MSHTPGPWTAELGVREVRVDAVLRDMRTICTIHRDDAEGSNTRLIAAAPDLLEALKGFLADIEDYQRINHLGGENNHWHVIARAAIAKAEGRASDV